jgi:hypothetical protein
LEVTFVLDPADQKAFDGMVSGLRAGDPTFARRLDRINAPRIRHRKATAVLLWAVAPILVVIGGWTGFFMAVAGAGYGAHVMLRARKLERHVGASRSSSSGRRPGAAL